MRFTPLKFSSYLLIYCFWNCPLLLGLVSLIQVFKQIWGCCHQLLFFQTVLPKWRLKKITVKGSSVKQRLMITGLVSWVIISIFILVEKCGRKNVAKDYFWEKELTWSGLATLQSIWNSIHSSFHYFIRCGVYQTQSTLCLGVECGVEFLGVNPSQFFFKMSNF